MPSFVSSVPFILRLPLLSRTIRLEFKGEFKMSTLAARYTCGNCGVRGHNSRTCSEPLLPKKSRCSGFDGEGGLSRCSNCHQLGHNVRTCCSRAIKNRCKKNGEPKKVRSRGRTLKTFGSSSVPGAFHEVRRGLDGKIYCTCGGWKRYRRCWHLEQVLSTIPALGF